MAACLQHLASRFTEGARVANTTDRLGLNIAAGRLIEIIPLFEDTPK